MALLTGCGSEGGSGSGSGSSLSSQFNERSTLKCDESNAKFFVNTMGGSNKIDAYACIIDGVVYRRALKYEEVYDNMGNYAGPPIGYREIYKSYTIGKQEPELLSSGNLLLTEYAEENEGIVKYVCVSDNLQGECSSKVDRELMYKRR